MTDADQIKYYAVGILTEVVMGVELVQYLERIDATLEPFGGSFLVHGDEPLVHEGTSPGSLILIEFPTGSGAVDWYQSRDYQALIPLRADNSNSTILTVNGVSPGHRSTDVLTQ